jgi:hypothetical protein
MTPHHDVQVLLPAVDHVVDVVGAQKDGGVGLEHVVHWLLGAYLPHTHLQERTCDRAQRKEWEIWVEHLRVW